jgi:hypothetical protein
MGSSAPGKKRLNIRKSLAWKAIPLLRQPEYGFKHNIGQPGQAARPVRKLQLAMLQPALFAINRIKHAYALQMAGDLLPLTRAGIHTHGSADASRYNPHIGTSGISPPRQCCSQLYERHASTGHDQACVLLERDIFERTVEPHHNTLNNRIVYEHI